MSANNFFPLNKFAQILCYKNQGIHWYHFNPTFLLKINFTLVRRADLSFNLRHFWPMKSVRRPRFREKRIDISRFLALYIYGIRGEILFLEVWWHCCLFSIDNFQTKLDFQKFQKFGYHSNRASALPMVIFISNFG